MAAVKHTWRREKSMRKQPRGFRRYRLSNFNQWETTPRSSSWIKDLHRGVYVSVVYSVMFAVLFSKYVYFLSMRSFGELPRVVSLVC